MSERWASYGRGWSGAFLFGPDKDRTDAGVYKAEHSLGCCTSEAVAKYIVKLHNDELERKKK